MTAKIIAHSALGEGASRACADVIAELEAMIRSDDRHARAFEAIAHWMTDRRVLLGLLRRPGALRLALLRRQAADHGGDEGLITQEVGDRLCRRRTLLGLLRRSPATGHAILLASLFGLDLSRRREAQQNLAEKLRRLAEASSQPREPEGELLGLHRRFEALEQAKIADEAELLELRIRFAASRQADGQARPDEDDRHG